MNCPVSRIPFLQRTDVEGAHKWFAEMAAAGLIFHPEDEPSDIVMAASGAPLFSSEEADEVANIIQLLSCELGHDLMIETCYPIFMKAAGFPPYPEDH